MSLFHQPCKNMWSEVRRASLKRSEKVSQLTIACCQRLLCDCESLIRFYKARFIAQPSLAQHCQIWSLQSNPALISVCSVISHGQYVLKSNEEDTSSESNKTRRIAADGEARQSGKERLISFLFVPLPNCVLHNCVCVPSIKQILEEKKKLESLPREMLAQEKSLS